MATIHWKVLVEDDIFILSMSSYFKNTAIGGIELFVIFLHQVLIVRFIDGNLALTTGLKT